MTTAFVTSDDKKTITSPRGAGTSLAPLHEEHEALLPHIDALAKAGDAVGEASPDELHAKVQDAVTFLTEHLIPHAKAEDSTLYVEVDRVLGGVPVTATMRRDHVEVGKLTDQLAELAPLTAGPLTTAQAQELRRVLYGVHAVVRLHFAKEEEVYVPLLQQKLTPEEGRALIERLEAAQKQAGHGESEHATH